MNKNSLPLLLITLTFALLTTSCIYRMPEDGEVSLIPDTNNREVIGDKAQGMIPGGSF